MFCNDPELDNKTMPTCSSPFCTRPAICGDLCSSCAEYESLAQETIAEEVCVECHASHCDVCKSTGIRSPYHEV